jgi:hypothetical protein
LPGPGSGVVGFCNVARGVTTAALLLRYPNGPKEKSAGI